MNKSNLFLVAAPRSGSTQLSDMLSQHSEIDLAAVKEPNYFSNHEFSPEIVKNTHLSDITQEDCFKDGFTNKKHLQFAIFRDVESYDSLFKCKSSKYHLDASTTYLHCPESPNLISKYNSDSKFIILIREPKSRIESHYRLAVRTGRVSGDLATCLHVEEEVTQHESQKFLLRPSFYHDAYVRYLKKFGHEKVKLVFFEDFISNPQKLVEELFFFLNLESIDIQQNTKFKNEGLTPRFKTLNVMLTKFGVKSFIKKNLSFNQISFLKSLIFKRKKENLSLNCLDKYSEEFLNDAERLRSLGLNIPQEWNVK